MARLSRLKSSMESGINRHLIAQTPVAIIDFETTGLTVGLDRVVEVSIVRVDPDQKPRLLLDTLVNPNRPMGATEIHGITDADVQQAPKFSDIAGEVLAVTAGCVVAAYNVYFDIRFLAFELGLSGVNQLPPHFCLMYLRPMLGLGGRCKLGEACKNAGIERNAAHMASADAMSSGELFVKYLAKIDLMGINTYGELAKLGDRRFSESFGYSPLPNASLLGLTRCKTFISRAANASNIHGVGRNG